MTSEQWDDAELQAEVLALVEQIETPNKGWASFRPYSFDTLDLTVRGFENAAISVGGVVFDPRDPPQEATVEDDAFVFVATELPGGSRATGLVIGNVLDNDADGTTLSGQTSISNSANGPVPSVIIDENGDVILWQGSGTNFIGELDEGETLAISGTYTTTSGDTATVNITIVGVDDPLTVTSGGTIEVDGFSINQTSRINIVDFDDDIVSARIIDDPNTLVDNILIYDFDSGVLSLNPATADNFSIVIEEGSVDFLFETTNADGEIELFDLSVGVRGLGGVLPPPPPPPPPPLAGFVDDFGL